eukprot:CAMPEP_0204327094 /NCGR_PEP_ID=MMETSP0469-20131031/12331_1 /ASSEMBLY_ACC=CAM_ASM_000384 /TAXON_ID=2969 /ORGANISM="Oxyrrhis marina" /LENGTH=303 /DNA_ID=CAMNT_0051309271 /DNA_START=39 /DNA_END=953 /DNA_ORIENTATION=-
MLRAARVTARGPLGRRAVCTGSDHTCTAGIVTAARAGSGLAAGATRGLHVTHPEVAEAPAYLENSVEELFANNLQWRESLKQKDPEFFTRMAKGQKPRYLWIGCADSRVPAETICGLPPGSLFVHRNIANMVNNVDVSAMSVIQFAVTVLKVQHIVICGHYNCGGVMASMKNVDHGSPLENWLRNIRDVYRLHREELDRIGDMDERGKRLVELNVVEQAINLYKARTVQARRVETMQNLSKYGFVQPRIHPVVYDPGTGELRRLDVLMREWIRDLVPIYNLYSIETSPQVEWDGMGCSMTLPP